ncbi:MAG: hypothetical protein WC686_05695, partial [Candidatus Shapirobacteria bacterium]
MVPQLHLPALLQNLQNQPKNQKTRQIFGHPSYSFLFSSLTSKFISFSSRQIFNFTVWPTF